MAFDEKLVARVDLLLKRKKGIGKLNMFGGICYLLYGNMIGGVHQDRLIIRVGPEKYVELLSRKHVKPMDFTGKPLTGFLYIDKRGCSKEKELKSWLDLGLAHASTFPKKTNKRAKKLV